MTRIFRALTTNVAVDIDDDVVLAAVARAIIASYPASDDVELRYHLRGGAQPVVRRDAAVLHADGPEDLVPMFEMDLYEQVVARAEPGWILHAAALEVDGKALVLCGPSGAGKTTLTLALAGRGLRLLTEEVVWIDRSGTVRGLPRPIHIPAGSRQHDRVPKDWLQLSYPIRGRDGVVRQNVLVVPPSSVFELGALPLHTIVRIGHGPDWPTHLRRSLDHVALQRLWDRSLRQDDVGLAAATEVLRQFSSYELSSTSESEALQLLDTLLK